MNLYKTNMGSNDPAFKMLLIRQTRFRKVFEAIEKIDNDENQKRIEAETLK
jgi:hypothetical protein